MYWSVLLAPWPPVKLIIGMPATPDSEKVEFAAMNFSGAFKVTRGGRVLPPLSKSANPITRDLTMKALTTLLVANRGEIAVPVMRTAKAMGLKTVAVYSEVDANAQHVREADQSVCIGPAPVADSYLELDAILDAAERTGADCIHPGYGFLSENQAFASACEAKGIEFIGPPMPPSKSWEIKSGQSAP